MKQHRNGAIVAAVLLAATISCAASVASSTTLNQGVVPGAIPDRVVLTWLHDPAVTQAVTWRTVPGAARGMAQIQPATDGVLPETPNTIAASANDLVTSSGPARYFTTEFAGLTPWTLYAYRVGDGSVWSEWFHFRTAKRESARFSFLYFGDVQNDIRTHWSRIAREALREVPHAAFTLHAGDLVNRGNNDSEWGEWFSSLGWVNASIPVVAAAGNHEYVTASGTREENNRVRVLTDHWRRQFAYPSDDPAGMAGTCYFFDYQGVRIVVLNSNEKYVEQAVWLRTTLRRNPMRWTILAFHHPFFSPAAKRTAEEDEEQQRLREAWKPIIDEFRVDLVLNGHDHTYARSSIKNVPIGYPADRDLPNGTMYVTSVSGPKMYRLGPAGWAVRVAQATQLYQVVTVDGDELNYEARTASNNLYDAFTLVKRFDADNELRELLPPERRDVPIPTR